MLRYMTTNFTQRYFLFNIQIVHPVIEDPDQLMTVALDCLYACKRSDQLTQAVSICECLPKRSDGLASDDSISLHKQVS